MVCPLYRGGRGPYLGVSIMEGSAVFIDICTHIGRGEVDIILMSRFRYLYDIRSSILFF